MWRYTQLLYAHVLLLYNCERGAVDEGLAEQTVPTAKNDTFAHYCKQVWSGNGIAGNCSKNVAEHLRPGLNEKHKGNTQRGKTGMMLKTLKDRARKEAGFILKKWVL